MELKILKHLKDNDKEDENHIVRIKDFIIFRNHVVLYNDIFLVYSIRVVKHKSLRVPPELIIYRGANGPMS
jgi:hypothetical protein